MIADETLALLRDVARDGDVAALLQALAENGDPYDVKGQINDFEDLANELDELRDEVKANELAVTEAEEKLEAEEDAHRDTKAELRLTERNLARLELEIDAIRRAEEAGTPLPPRSEPVEVKLLVAQKLAEALDEVGQALALVGAKAGPRTAAGKAARETAQRLFDRSRVERSKVARATED